MLIFIPLLALAIFLPCLAGWRVLAGFDYPTLYYPFMEYARDFFAGHGTLPFWIPGFYGGMPFVESPVNGFCYPTTMLAWAFGLPVHGFFALDAFLHFVAAGTGVYMLGRFYGLHPLSSAFGGAVFMLGGFLAAQLPLGCHEIIRGTAFVPWIFYLCGRASRDGGWKWWVLAGAGGGLMVLAENLQLLAYTAILLAGWGLAGNRLAGRARVLAGLLLSGITALVLGAAVFIPESRYALHSLRSVADIHWSSIAPFSPSDIFPLVLPGLWGKGAGYFGPGDFEGPPKVFYLGIIPVLLAGYAVAAQWVRSRPPVFLGLAALVLASARYFIPDAGFSLPFRFSYRWMVFFCLAFSIVAAMGLEEIRAGGERALRKLALGALLFAVPLVLVASFPGPAWNAVRQLPWLEARISAGTIEAPAAQKSFRRALVRASGVGAGVAGLSAVMAFLPASGTAAMVLAVAGCAELAWVSFPGLGISPPAALARLADPDGYAVVALAREEKPFRVLTEEPEIILNSRVASGIEWLGGLHPAPLGNFVEFHDFALTRGNAVNMLSWLNTRFWITRSGGSRSGLTPVGEFIGHDRNAYRILKFDETLPRAFFAESVEGGIPRKELLERISRTPARNRKVFMGKVPEGISRGGSARQDAGETSPLRGGKARVISFEAGANTVSAVVQSSSSRLLVFSEVYFPAWEARVNGKRAKISEVNGLLRGVVVGPGRTEVILSYNSTLFRLGLLVSMLAWSLTLAWLLRWRTDD
jgi:hypothetical protein